MVHRPGQSLIEVLLALAIILVGILSLVSALINAHITAAASVDSAIAVQLAREPIEAARFIRDSNWLERENGLGTAFNDGLSSATETNDYTAIYSWNPQKIDLDQSVKFDFDPNDSSDSLTAVYRGPSGLYRPPPTTSLSGFNITIYSRFVTLFPICSSNGGVTEQLITSDGQDCATTYPGTSEIGLQISSTVTWSSRGADRTVTLEDRLYDWRYAQP